VSDGNVARIRSREGRERKGVAKVGWWCWRVVAVRVRVSKKESFGTKVALGRT
jgi:hypothetical protein